MSEKTQRAARRSGPGLVKAPGGGRLVFDLSKGPGLGLVSALKGVLDHAREATKRVDEDPERAVHEWRKSLRRARTLLRFSRPLLEPRAYDAMSARLAKAARETSSLRDAHILDETLRLVPHEPRTRAVRAVIGASLRKRRVSATTPARVREVLRRASMRLRGLEARFASALSDAVEWEDLEDSLRQTHRRMRRTWRGALQHRTDAEVHAWRKRTKELRYELEMLASARGRYAERQHRALVRLAERLGEVTDLIILHDYVRAWEARSGGRDPARLLSQVRRLIRKRLSRVLERARPIAERRPRRFAAKALASVRRD